MILNTIVGSGVIFLNASGTVLVKRLAPGEELLCDGACVVAFEPTVFYDVRSVRVGACVVA